jgi:hypothetical protein
MSCSSNTFSAFCNHYSYLYPDTVKVLFHFAPFKNIQMYSIYCVGWNPVFLTQMYSIYCVGWNPVFLKQILAKFKKNIYIQMCLCPLTLYCYFYLFRIRVKPN